MMSKQLFWMCLFLLVAVTPTQALEVGGKIFPDTLDSGTEMLMINGGGIRKKMIIKVYSAGLYLKKKSDNASSIVLADVPMAIRLHIISGMVTPEKMEKSTRKGFDKSRHALAGLLTTSIDKEIDQFVSLFKDGIDKDDVYDLIYTPDVGVKAYKNRQLKSTVKGLDFKRALFGIWLSDEPVQSDLKKRMLGNNS